MTNHFNRKLGEEWNGSIYYGKLLHGEEVAVKVVDGSSKKFFKEVCSPPKLTLDVEFVKPRLNLILGYSVLEEFKLEFRFSFNIPLFLCFYSPLNHIHQKLVIFTLNVCNYFDTLNDGFELVGVGPCMYVLRLIYYQRCNIRTW